MSCKLKQSTGRTTSSPRYHRPALRSSFSATPIENIHAKPLVLSAPGMASLEVPVMHKVGPGGPSVGGEVVQVEIWDSTCKAIDQGNAAAAWLGEFLGRVSEYEPAPE